ncbi:MAG: hypothetical protein COW87_01960 [Candidatus Levybacteria bacterium CG22_combo_CG10-13_8_21_14_all_35_11]|nr:MAG: hypothetical protein COW87_01960 [Candidatus Levybacteria bacterium CG22_combo_CG10-13_8_21_14_all_35_11]
MDHNINLNDVLPSYLIPLFNHSQWTNTIILCLFLIVALWLYIQYLKIKTQLDATYTFLEIRPTADSVKSAFSTKQLFSVLHSVCEPLPLFGSFVNVKRTISCELVSTKEDGIRYILRVPREDTSVIRKQLLAYLTGIEIREVKDYLFEKPEDVTIRELKLTRKYIYPLQEQSVLQEYDPIAYITASMTKLEIGELVALHMVCTPVTETTHSSVLSYTGNLHRLLLKNKALSDELNRNIAHDIVTFIMDFISHPKNERMSETGMFQQQIHKEIGGKISQPLFEVAVRLVIISPDKVSIKSRLKGLQSSLDTFSTPQQKLKIRQPFLSVFGLKIVNRYMNLKLKKRLLSFSDNPILSVSELSSLYHLPYTTTTKTEDIVQNKSPKLPSPLSFKQEDNQFDIIFAHNTYGETTTDIGLTLEERRRHAYIIGATGTGKTTLLTHMIYQDMVNGNGLAVIDPHGDLVEKLLGVIPKERIKDVVYFNPYDIEFPIGLNVLEIPEGLSEVELQREKDFITSTLISIFHKLYDPRYSGPRMEHILRNVILTALEQEKPTLFTIYDLLTNMSYRKKVTSELKDEVLKAFWKNEFEKLGSFQKAEQISPITNKLGRFLTTSMTRNILNQSESKLDFEKIMNHKKILICNLSKGKIGGRHSLFPWRAFYCQNTAYSA